MTLYEIATQLCRLKECNDFPIRYKRDVERMIHALNQINTHVITNNVDIYSNIYSNIEEYAKNNENWVDMRYNDEEGDNDR